MGTDIIFDILNVQEYLEMCTRAHEYTCTCEKSGIDQDAHKRSTFIILDEKER
jgi:hypothetical protein